jgi:hypothetical protein
LKRDRDQLWAEAAAREAEGVSIRLPKELWDAAGTEQEKHTIEEPWVEVIQELLGDIKGKLLCGDAWLLVGMLADKRTQNHSERLGVAMKACGWERKKKSFGKLGTKWAYVRIEAADGELPRISVDYDPRSGTVTVLLGDKVPF